LHPLPPESDVPTDQVLTDRLARPLQDLRISVTDRCNFRCSYCMPAEIFGDDYAFLPRAEVLSFEEIERVTRIFVALGVQKLRVTGGEPLVRADLPKLIALLARIDGVQDLALTTNGYLLASQARALADAGLRRITVSLDSIDPDTFAQMNGRGLPLERVLAGIEAAEKAGLGPIKLNSVVQRGVNDHQVAELARHFRGSGHIVRFIEFMDVGTRNGWKLDQVVPAVAKRWSYADGSGEIGIIASVTQPFCRGCTRLRLSADGHLYTCLFAHAGHDLKTPLRDGEDDAALAKRIRGLWRVREDRYSELRTAETPERDGRVEMYQIGG
jgi:cyclic pyranopterin phosphate synthase